MKTIPKLLRPCATVSVIFAPPAMATIKKPAFSLDGKNIYNVVATGGVKLETKKE